MPEVETVLRIALNCAQSCRSKADIDKYKWVADEKLYADNDFVNEHHLSRHCIGLSGMKFTDAEIEELAEKFENERTGNTPVLFYRFSDRKAGIDVKGSRT